MRNSANPIVRMAAEASHSLSKTLANVQRRARARIRPRLASLPEILDQISTESSPAISPTSNGPRATSSQQSATSNGLLVNARPEQVQAHEFYAYRLVASAYSQTCATDPPSGEVRVQIPYDGFRHFPRETARQLNKHLAGASLSEVEGQAGWLALSAGLDWASDWSRPFGVETMPVTIPLRGETLLSDEGWIADELRAVAGYSYTPDNLPFWPLSLDVQVCDDVPAPVESLRRGAWQMQPGQLVMTLTVSASIPTTLCPPGKRIEVEIERMELEWPTTAAAWQLDISQVDTLSPSGGAGERQVSWRYNSDHSTVELRDVRAYRGDSEPGSPLTPYRCHLRFVLRSPGQLIAKGKLDGVICLRLKGVLLSGREIAWIEARGYRRPLPARRSQERETGQKTLLRASFTVPLNQGLDCRQTMTCQRWYFPGISLSVECMADIAAALHDLGYQVRQNALSETASGQLTATRLVSLANGEPTTLHIQLLAGCTPCARADSSQPADEGTSGIVIHAQGQLQGPASIVGLDLNRLMTMLKKRLAAVADV